jgi:hypothetical protein
METKAKECLVCRAIYLIPTQYCWPPVWTSLDILANEREKMVIMGLKEELGMNGWFNFTNLSASLVTIMASLRGELSTPWETCQRRRWLALFGPMWLFRRSARQREWSWPKYRPQPQALVNIVVTVIACLVTAGQPHSLRVKAPVTLNVVFMKWSWTWTTAVSLPLILTSPVQRTRRPLQWIFATRAWYILTLWFLGQSFLLV